MGMLYALSIKIKNGFRIKKPSSSQLFFKYLFSYLATLFLPLLIMSILLYHYFFGILEDEVKKNNMSMLVQIQNEMDALVQGLNAIAFQIYEDPNLTTFQLTHNVPDIKQKLGLLKNYIIGNKFIDEVFLYCRNPEKIYTSTCVVEPSGLFNIYHHRTGFTSVQFDHDMDVSANTIKSPWNTRELNDKQFIIYIVPKQNQFINNKKTVFFTIKNSAVIDMLNNNIGNTVIFDKKLQVVASQRDESYISSEEFQKLAVSLDRSTSDTVYLERTKYFVSYIKSGTTGWLYVTLTPFGIAMKKVVSVKLVFLYVIFFILIAAGILIAYVMRLNYKPIKKLRIYAETVLGRTLKDTNDIETVQISMNHMLRTREELEKKLEENYCAIKDFLLLNLLNGSFHHIEEFNEKAKDIGVAFKNSFYRIAIFSIGRTEGMAVTDWPDIIRDMEGTITGNLEGYGIHRLGNHNHTMIFIFGLDRDRDDIVQELLLSMQQRLDAHWQLRPSIGVGNVYDRIDHLGKSYIEASSAIDYRLTRGPNKIIVFKEVVTKSFSFLADYPIKELTALEEAIINGNAEEVDETVNSIISKIKEADMPIFSTKCFCFDMINTIIKAMHTVEKEYILSIRQYQDVEKLGEFETVEELGESIRKINTDICLRIKENREAHSAELMDKLVAYVKENYKDYHFSVESMAEKFGLSLNYLGKHFKKETGMTVTEYVSHLRIERAKELLLAGNDTLEEIVAKIGYSDTSSFVRKFRNAIGITPGAFRSKKSRGISP